MIYTKKKKKNIKGTCRRRFKFGNGICGLHECKYAFILLENENKPN